MRAGSSVDTLARSVYSALLQDLPAVKETLRRGTKEPGLRRPYEDEVMVTMFLQAWGSTALGFGGIEGQAITSASTVVVHNECAAAVYFAGRLAYVLDPCNNSFISDLTRGDMADVRGAGKYRVADRAKASGAEG